VSNQEPTKTDAPSCRRDTPSRRALRAIGGAAALLLIGAQPLEAADEFGPPRPFAATESREPCASYAPLRQPFFGDTHVHTGYSFDASTQDTRNTPRDAYRFARGERIGIQPYDDAGEALRTIQLARPIDFTVVTDHSEMMGEIALCMTPGSEGYDSILCRIHRNYPTISFKILAARSLIFKTRLGICGDDEGCGRAAAGVWEATRDAAEEAYDRFGPKFSIFARKRAPAPSNFVRQALKEGLQLQVSQGANPFRYGIVASTDTHIAAPGLTAEKDHPGHGGAGIGAGDGVPQGFPDDVEFNPGGLAVLWAEENSRDALFSAMQRREAYGTSGTRPLVRFFGGWDYPDDLCAAADFAAQGYLGGVPMGGELLPRPAEQPDAAPRFALWAVQDPGSASAPGTPLQRAQIVKGWVEDGELHERVIDVAGGDNGAGVDPATCETQGTGSRSLCSVWTDPDFDPATPAFYYARVLENPTCRWSQYVCNAAGVTCDGSQEPPEALSGCCDGKVPPTIQERAWTSPVWYTP